MSIHINEQLKKQVEEQEASYHKGISKWMSDNHEIFEKPKQKVKGYFDYRFFIALRDEKTLVAITTTNSSFVGYVVDVDSDYIMMQDKLDEEPTLGKVIAHNHIVSLDYAKLDAVQLRRIIGFRIEQ